MAQFCFILSVSRAQLAWLFIPRVVKKTPKELAALTKRRLEKQRVKEARRRQQVSDCTVSLCTCSLRLWFMSLLPLVLCRSAWSPLCLSCQ